LLFILFFGPVPEELGWRGYALYSLQDRWNALVASVILGIMWALWHLPLFFIQGTYQFNLGMGTVSFWLFMLSIIPQSILITWIYNNTQRSILSAIMYHFMLNLTGELTAISPLAEGLYFGLWLVAAIVVAAVCGFDELRKMPKQKGIGVQNRTSSMEAALHD
jgi:membrane protease YdiL (CAAX protease family)